MKLSKHGREHLGYHEAIGLGIGSYDFQQEDFVGGIVLTVEEVNLLFKVIDGFFDLRLPTTKEIVALNKLKVRVERIEQAEMSIAST